MIPSWATNQGHSVLMTTSNPPLYLYFICLIIKLLWCKFSDETFLLVCYCNFHNSWEISQDLSQDLSLLFKVSQGLRVNFHAHSRPKLLEI